MKIFILGGDGFCGWPVALRLSKENHDVHIIDNLSRRKIDLELNTKSLTKIKSIYERINKWKELTGKDIKFHLLDLTNEYNRFLSLINKFNPDTIIHLAEQRAAPYSMKNSSTARYTVNNNLNNTNNVLCAIIESKLDIHLIHLGTMGVYGYGSVPNTVLPEGYVDIKMKDKFDNYKDVKILHPAYPGSIYHMTKTQDALFFQFYNKNYKIRITDLHQGIIWGYETEETKMHEDLMNRFDYDSDYGTCLNRFIVQALNNYPLTVYWTGEQTRAFINIQNSVDCLSLAVNNPPRNNEKVHIYNQITETISLNEIVNLLKKIHDCKVKNLDNPRNELIKNTLEAENNNFINLGLNPILLNEKNLSEILISVKELNVNFNKLNNILPVSNWNKFSSLQ